MNTVLHPSGIQGHSRIQSSRKSMDESVVKVNV